MLSFPLKIATHLRATYKSGFERGTRVIVSAARLEPVYGGISLKVEGIGWISSWWTELYRPSSVEKRYQVRGREQTTSPAQAIKS